MLYTHLLLRYGELFLKRGNLPLFERYLLKSIKKIAGISEINKARGRLIIPYTRQHALLHRVFGLRSYSPAILAEKSMPEIQIAMLGLINSYAPNDFIIRTQRSDKSFPLNSLEVSKVVGQYVEEKSPNRFNIKSSNIFHIEINREGVFLFLEVISCLGGLPVGVEGRVALLLEDEASILAGILMMKRGCAVYPVVLREEGAEKALSLLQAFSPERLQVHVVGNFGELERFMQERRLAVLAVGDVMGEMKSYDNMVVLRPLVAYSGEDIAGELEKFKV